MSNSTTPDAMSDSMTDAQRLARAGSPAGLGRVGQRRK